MIKYEFEEFEEIITEELKQYEITDLEINNWKKGFKDLVKNKKISNKNLDKNKFQISDEMEIFSIVDDYINALDDNSLSSYWDSFK